MVDGIGSLSIVVFSSKAVVSDGGVVELPVTPVVNTVEASVEIKVVEDSVIVVEPKETVVSWLCVVSSACIVVIDPVLLGNSVLVV